MRVTRWGEYGVLCSLVLARRAHEQGTVGTTEIAETLKMPVDYAHQVLHRLRKGGIVKSVRGPGGGFALARPPAAVNLREILEAAEGATFDVICDSDPIDSEVCHSAIPCSLSAVWHELRTVIDGFLAGITLEQLMSRERAGDALVSLSSNRRQG